jgi:hypothetical protein
VSWPFTLLCLQISRPSLSAFPFNLFLNSVYICVAPSIASQQPSSWRVRPIRSNNTTNKQRGQLTLLTGLETTAVCPHRSKIQREELVLARNVTGIVSDRY